MDWHVTRLECVTDDGKFVVERLGSSGWVVYLWRQEPQIVGVYPDVIAAQVACARYEPLAQVAS